MRTILSESGKRKIVFLSHADKEILIYMNTDVWITPELKRFKNDLLERVRAKDLKSNSER